MGWGGRGQDGFRGFGEFHFVGIGMSLVAPIAYLKLTKLTKVTMGAFRGTRRPGYEKTASGGRRCGGVR